MPLLMLWGHGSFRTSYGYFVVPANVEIQFFVDDNQGLDGDAVACFERGDLSQGVTDQLVTNAKKVQTSIQRINKTAGAAVKNYRLESILEDPLAPNSKIALTKDNVWTPKEDEEAFLVNIVRENGRRGTQTNPLVIQWCACTSNYVGDEEASAPVPRGSKKKATNSRCYISTATCSSLGLPEDCEPLNKLRWFRDRILLEQPGGAADVSEYYRSAPAIVRAIEHERSSRQIYRDIYDNHLVPALAAIDQGDHESAYRIYAQMVGSLRRRFLR